MGSPRSGLDDRTRDGLHRGAANYELAPESGTIRADPDRNLADLCTRRKAFRPFSHLLRSYVHGAQTMAAGDCRDTPSVAICALGLDYDLAMR